jgi:predicted lactoylglutathione lyase
MYNKVYTFIYLYSKLGLKFNMQLVQGTLMQMSLHLDCSEIIEILLHNEEFKPYIMQVVLPAAL